MKFGLDIAMDKEYSDINKLIELAISAERAGWDGFFLWDIINHTDSEQREVPVADVTVALSAIAARTSKIKIGIFVCAIPRRRPWKLAREMISIDHLSNGRLILGVGLGYLKSDFNKFGEEDDLKIRAEMTDEALDIIEGLWSGEPFSFSGEYYDIDNVQFLPKPLQQPRIPIWGGGRNRHGFARAARYDGIYPMIPPNIEELSNMRDFIKEVRGDLENFNLSLSGELLSKEEDPRQILQELDNAGLDWWIEWSQDEFDDQVEFVKRGPPIN